MTAPLRLGQRRIGGVAQWQLAFAGRAAVRAGAVVAVGPEIRERASRPRPDLDLIERLHTSSCTRAGERTCCVLVTGPPD